jgi:hypothetical protein
LSAEEVEEFQRELLTSVISAAQTGTTSSMDGVIAAWQGTAEIYEDPALLDLLMAPLPDVLHEVLPPSAPLA